MVERQAFTVRRRRPIFRERMSKNSTQGWCCQVWLENRITFKEPHMMSYPQDLTLGLGFRRHVLAPRTKDTDKESKTIPRDERFGLSKSTTFTRGTLQGAINLLWALLNNAGTGPLLVSTVVGALVVGFLAGNLAEQYLPEDALDTALHLLDGRLPASAQSVQKVASYVIHKYPVGRAAGTLAGLAVGAAVLK